MVNESTFLKGKICIYKGFMDVLYILTIGVKEKPQNVSSVEFSMCSADLTCVNGSTIQLVLHELLLRINLWVFE